MAEPENQKREKAKEAAQTIVQRLRIMNEAAEIADAPVVSERAYANLERTLSQKLLQTAVAEGDTGELAEQ